jgi:hypothetical protein
MTLYDDLSPARRGVAISGSIEQFLSALKTSNDVFASGVHSGVVQALVNTKALGFIQLSLDPGSPPVPYRWKALAGGGFQVDLLLSEVPALKQLISFADPNNVLHAARVETEPDPGGGAPKQWLTKTGDPVDLHADLALRVHGTPASPATIAWLKFEVGQDPQDDVFVVQPTPPQILFGDSGFGIDLTSGVVIDDSTTVSVPHGPPPAWTGVTVSNAKLYVPRDIPLIGGRPIDFDLQLGRPGGLAASTHVTLAGDVTHPNIDIRLEWQDPGATSLADLLPTAIEAAAAFPLAGRQEQADGKAFTLAGGDPMTVRVRCARALPPATAVSFEVSVDAAGPDGLVKATGTDPGGKAVVTAAALATALVADSTLSSPSPSGDQSGIWLHELLTAAAGASAFFDSAGKVVIDRVAVSASSGDGEPALRLRVDYLVDVAVTTFDVGIMSIAMDENQPMRIRYRNVAVETTGSDLTSIHLSFDEATLDVENPGLWKVHSPGSLLDIVGTRSGHGSLWYEVALKFKADLGPITISDATVRITAGNAGLQIGLRGLSVDLATAALTGHGEANVADTGFSADLWAKLGDPLGIAARVFFAYTGGGLLLGVVGALPGPIPLGPTGLGLYSVGGLFGINVHPTLAPGDIVESQLMWKETDVVADPGAMMFGLSAGVGTVYDLAFTFSATGNLVLTVPDVAFRLAVNAAVLSPPDFVNTDDSPLQGLIVVDDTGIIVAARGRFDIEHLLQLAIPLDARLPFADPSSWYFRLGSDGAPDRPPGPMTAKVLPDLFDIGGSAYLMVQGDTIDRLGNVGDPVIDLPGPAIGFGIGVDLKWGVPSPIWLQLSARARAGLATSPWFLAGSGTISGALHLGPFSIGAHATLSVQVGPGAALAAQFRVCGSIDLWFTEIEGCVNLSIGGHAPTTVPDPGPWGATKVSLSDRHYVEMAVAAGSADTAPVVWPDIVPIVAFDLGPDTSHLTLPAPGADPAKVTSFTGIDWLQSTGATGNDKLRYLHRLTKVQLWQVDPGGASTLLTDGLEAAWQQPKHTEAIGVSSGIGTVGARELALLTYRSDMWAHRRNDGARNTAPGVDPVTTTATACRARHEAGVGWALGDRAYSSGPLFVLPAAPETAEHASLFTATVSIAPWTEGVMLSEATMSGLLSAPLTFRPAGVISIDPVIAVDRRFAAALALPAVSSPLGLEESTGALGDDTHMAVTITADDSLQSAQLWVVLEQFYDLLDEISVTDIDSNAAWFVTSPQKLPDGRLRVAYTAPADTRGARVEYPVLQGITVLGLYATTDTAASKARAASAKDAKSAGRISAHNGTPPQYRTPLKLKPDTLYKIAIGTQVGGTVDGGKSETVFPAGGEAAGEFWFRTAKQPAPGAPAPDIHAAHAPIPQLVWHETAWTQEKFRTDYLARYLSSYTPADRSQDWYLDDPLIANFDQDHVDQLAALYGYTLDLQCQRTDGPPQSPADPDPWLVTLNPVWRELADIDVLDPLDKRYLTEIDPAASCPVFKAGASLGAAAEDLQPQATYQLQVAFTPSGGAPPAAPLAGVIFSTSRYHNPDAQIADLGFGSPAAGQPNGQLLVDTAPLPPAQACDSALAGALELLGVDGWPLPSSGRTSVLWARETLALVGVLIESPEPLAREGRVDVVSLHVNGIQLAAALSDSTRCRYLFSSAPAIPMAPGTAVNLSLTYNDLGVVKTAMSRTTSPVPAEVLL